MYSYVPRSRSFCVCGGAVLVHTHTYSGEGSKGSSSLAHEGGEGRGTDLDLLRMLRFWMEENRGSTDTFSPRSLDFVKISLSILTQFGPLPPFFKDVSGVLQKHTTIAQVLLLQRLRET